MARRTTSKTTEPVKYEAPSEDEDLIDWCERKRKQGRKRHNTRQWKLNTAYVLGQQWLGWDNNTRTFRRPVVRRDDPNPPVRITVNKIGGIAERFIARLTKSAPTPECRPVTNDEDDMGAAKAGTRILGSEYNRLGWDSLLTRGLFWPVTHGHAYAQIMWDITAGKVMGAVDEEKVNSGEVTFDWVAAPELAVDPNAAIPLGEPGSDAKWAVRTRTITKEACWEHYGRIPEDAKYERPLVDEVYQLNDDNSTMTQQSDENMIAVHQMWVLPSRAAPKGLVITYSGKTVLEKIETYPYRHGKLPFCQLNLLPGLGRREGRTWMDDLIAIQTDYNDARSREATLRRTLTPKVFAPVGSIDPKRLTSRLEVVLYNPVGDVPRVEIPDSGWMAQFEQGMSRADMEMGDRAGQSDVSSGKPASASQPAAAILALQEADDTKMAISYKELASFIKNAALMHLDLVRQFWSSERTVRTWSEDGAIEVAYFSRSDIEHELDVWVSTETGTAHSKSAQVQMVMDLVDRKIIVDPRDVLRVLNMPGLAGIAETFGVDAQQAQRENEHLWLDDLHIEVHPFDNHQIHSKEHGDFMKSAEYETALAQARAGDKEAEKKCAAFQAHYDAHQGLLLQAMGIPSRPELPGVGDPSLTQPLADPNSPAAGLGNANATPDYIDPSTGQPPDSLMAASGEGPSALSFGDADIRQAAGIGGPGQPGQVPGVSADQQAGSMGA